MVLLVRYPSEDLYYDLHFKGTRVDPSTKINTNISREIIRYIYHSSSRAKFCHPFLLLCLLCHSWILLALLILSILSVLPWILMGSDRPQAAPEAVPMRYLGELLTTSTVQGLDK